MMHIRNLNFYILEKLVFHPQDILVELGKKKKVKIFVNNNLISVLFYSYFHCSLIGYFLGLVTATVSSEVFKAAQPALLYLVPFTLLPLLTMAYLKVTFISQWVICLWIYNNYLLYYLNNCLGRFKKNVEWTIYNTTAFQTYGCIVCGSIYYYNIHLFLVSFLYNFLSLIIFCNRFTYGTTFYLKVIEVLKVFRWYIYWFF